MDELPEINIETLIDQYEVLLLDAYGVLVHSSGILAGAVEDQTEQVGTDRAACYNPGC